MRKSNQLLIVVNKNKFRDRKELHFKIILRNLKKWKILIKKIIKYKKGINLKLF